MKELPNFHGSDIEKVARYYNIDQNSIVNFSGNVNPLGLPESLHDQLVKHIDLVTCYPDPDYEDLKKSIAAYCKVSQDQLVLGSGTTELITHYIDYHSPKKALIVTPTYSEYAKKLEEIGSFIDYFPLSKENNFTLDIDTLIDSLSEDTDFIVLCNPNNPTATLTNSSQLERLFDFCRDHRIALLIDETYIDFVLDAERYTAIPLAESKTIGLVLRSFSKFFAAPGLRLGYGITKEEGFMDYLSKRQYHWGINSLAAYAGSQLVKNGPFIQKTLDLITNERNRMIDDLTSIKGVTVYPSKTNFVLFRIDIPNKSSKDLFDNLIHQGLMVRNASTFDTLDGQYIRFCIHLPENNTRLLQGIHKYLES